MQVVVFPDQQIKSDSPAPGVAPSVILPAVPGCRQVIRGLYVLQHFLPRFCWQISSYPAAATQATVTHASAANKYHILQQLVASFTPGSAYTADSSILNVVDGNTGGAKLLSVDIGSRSIAGGGPPNTFSLTGLTISGSTSTAMTVEFQAAGGAASLQKVWAFGIMANTATPHVQISDGGSVIGLLPLSDSSDTQIALPDICIAGSVGNALTINTDITPGASSTVKIAVVYETRSA